MRLTTWISTGFVAALACFASANRTSAQIFSMLADNPPPPQTSPGYNPVPPAVATPPITESGAYAPAPSVGQTCASGWYPCEMMGLPTPPCQCQPAPNRVCQSDWKSCTPCYSMVGGAESTFLFPYFHGASGRTLLTDGIIPITGATPGSNDISGHLIVAPRVWLGIQGEQWGLVGRYWNAQSWRSGVGPGDPILGTGMVSTNNFGAYLGDLEVQRRFVFGGMNLYGLCGIRYGSVRISQGLSTSDFLGGDFLSAQTRTSQGFNGTGITFGGWGTRAIGDTPFSLFFSNRYSILFGTASAGAQTSATVIDPVLALPPVINGAFARSNRSDLFIAEVQAGGQWQRPLNWFRGTAFLRSAFEFQYWRSNESVFAASGSGVFVGPHLATATASSCDIFFSMVGISLGAGIMY